MVFARGIGLRSVAKAAALCALRLSIVPTIYAELEGLDSIASASGAYADQPAVESPNAPDAATSTSTPMTTAPELTSLEICSVSDGDKAYGIQVIDDSACAAGGLGCYNDHCRYCKVQDTFKSTHLENCDSLDSGFASMAPLTVSTGPCVVSSGDAAVGISGVTDPTCLYGGLGCFNDHCRFCKTEDTAQSAHFLTCSWVEDPTDASTPVPTSTLSPIDINFVPIPTGEASDSSDASTFSSTTSPEATTNNPTKNEDALATTSANTCSLTATVGDAAVGINIVTDAICVGGGTGCIDSICRFCKTKTTPQSEHFEDCPTPKVCNTTVSVGDAAVGIEIISDTSCANGGVGCIDDVCRFCKLETTPQSAHLSDCSLFAPPTPAPVLCSQVASEGDAEVGIKIVTDATCSEGGLGCIDDVCRFCRATTTVQSASYTDCALIEGVIPSATTPTPTASPITTTATPVVTTPTPTTPTPTTPTPAPTCSQVASEGDAAVGIKIVTDATCVGGGLGCLDDVCRFCRVTTTTHSASFIDCALIEVTPPSTIAPTVPPTSTPTPTPVPTVATPSPPTSAPTPIATTAPVTPAPTPITTTAAPVATTAAPVATTAAPVATTAAPVATTASPNTPICNQVASEGDASVGIKIVTDATCVSGGLGCLDDICRFCRVTTTIQSASFIDCASIGLSSQAPATTTPTPTTAAPASTSPTGSIPLYCPRTVSSGDAKAGLDIVSDISCSEGGVGCLDEVCRFCKRFDTATSQSFLSCDSIPPVNAGTDINFVSIPIVDDSEMSESSVARLLVDSNSSDATAEDVVESASTTAGVCSLTPSVGDEAAGIHVVTDTSCASGGNGCVDSICRLCKAKATAQSALLDDCPTTKKCTTTVSEGDAALGINIITDATCANGGLGCMDSVCRLCKVKTTTQSAHLGDCSVFTAAATTAPPTVAPAKTTTAPATTTPAHLPISMECFQTVSSGDKNLGLDIVADISCSDGGVGCLSGICRFCKRFETTQSHSYMSCDSIPPSDAGKDINFTPIPIVNMTETAAYNDSDAIVELQEAVEYTPAPDICANETLADGEAEGGILIVLDPANCPKGLSPGCIGDSGCKYCKNFETNISASLDYCAWTNSTNPVLALSTSDAVSVSEDSSAFQGVLKNDTFQLGVGIGGCVAVAAVGILVVFAKKRTSRHSPHADTLSRNDGEEENDESGRSVLTASSTENPSVTGEV
ncbi:hypothetical protein BBJ28_00009535 [Nothophytophthora sp. Chile5]|nr:hypothetical protein BBJ28_00009535 [Nothophytophthora sp. Chile5]